MDKYTKFILTMIAVGIIGLNYHLFKDEIISPAHAVESHTHSSYEIYGIEDHSHSHTHSSYEIYGIEGDVEGIVEGCKVIEGAFNTYESGSYGNTWKIRC
jgi:hypothetical protein